MTVKELIEALQKYPMDKEVMLEANESGYQFADINTIKTIDVDYEHADDSIEEINVVVLSEQ